MRDFERRLADLERASLAVPMMYRLAGPSDMPIKQALAQLGLHPEERDLVVYCRQFRAGAAVQLLGKEPIASA